MRKRSFTLFCALLRSFADLRLHSLAYTCALLRSFACFCERPRLERTRLGTAESPSDSFLFGLIFCSWSCLNSISRVRPCVQVMHCNLRFIQRLHLLLGDCLGLPAPRAAAVKALYSVHNGNVEDLCVNFLRPFSLEIEGRKSAKQLPKFCHIFRQSLARMLPELRSGGLRPNDYVQQFLPM